MQLPRHGDPTPDTNQPPTLVPAPIIIIIIIIIIMPWGSREGTKLYRASVQGTPLARRQHVTHAAVREPGAHLVQGPEQLIRSGPVPWQRLCPVRYPRRYC
jgi:hypothetical protein